MPWVRPQTNNYFGFQPVNSPGIPMQTGLYLVSSTEVAFSAGDVVIQSSKNTARPLTITGGITNFTSSMAFLGVAAQGMPALVGSTNATINSNTSQMILLYDDPYQKYMVCDTTSGVIGTQLGQYKNYPLLTTGCVGSTGPRNAGLFSAISNQAISGVESTVAGLFHVLGLHPVENGIHSTVGAATAGSAVNVRKWIGHFVSGVGVQPSTGVLTVANTTS